MDRVLCIGNFVDVTKTDSIITRRWSNSAPRWRRARPGLCLEGKCKNDTCPAYLQRVILNQGDGDFCLLPVLSFNANVGCPECGAPVVPKKPAFNRCLWKIEAVKHSDQESIVHTPWKEAGDGYTTYDAATAGYTQFARLNIFVRSSSVKQIRPMATEDQSSKRCRDETILCPICLGMLTDTDETVLHPSGCGHKFHKRCDRIWKAARNEEGQPHPCLTCRNVGERVKV